MVVHYAGKPVDLDPILDLGYPVIEDAAHAVDSRYGGRACGSLGDVGRRPVRGPVSGTLTSPI